MERSRRNLILHLIAFSCGSAAVVLSALTLEGANTAVVIGLIAGSFGAGAALVSAIREFAARRSQGS